MDTRKAKPKRRSGRNDEKHSSPNGKRRRMHEPTKAPQPMDIDPPNGKETRRNGTDQPPVEAEGTVEHQTTIAPPPPALSQSRRPATSIELDPPPSMNPFFSSRYIPKSPPTVQQIVDKLRGTTPKSDAKHKTAVPKPPPPTPSLLSPRPTDAAAPIKQTLPRKSASRSQQRLFIIRTIAFVWFAVMIRVTLSYIETPSLGTVLDTVRSTSDLMPSRDQIQAMLPSIFHTKPPKARIYPHIQPPHHVNGTEPPHKVLTNTTLRDFLEHEEGFHLALAPAFFGIYAYVGAFMAWDTTNYTTNIQSVAGASAGAMAAVVLAAGIEPYKVASLGASMTLQKFADPLGIGGLFKGNKFEDILHDFLSSEKPNSSLLLQDADIPIAVTAFDLTSMQGRILTHGSMARAARASATFPFLFQPVLHNGEILIDGGITDMWGLKGLEAFPTKSPKRVLNVAVGGFLTTPPGRQSMPNGVKAKEVLSVSILNTPQCGPWAMENGPRAIEAARRAMLESLDLPLYRGQEKGHYELHIDATSYVE